MLKLQRKSRDGLVSVIIRDKEYLFTRSFSIALAIAIGIHATLVLLFHVSPFTLKWNNTVFTPTHVQADGAAADSTIADLTAPIQTLRGLPPIPSSQPMLMPQPSFLTVRPLISTKTESKTEMAFTKIEQKIYQPEFVPVVFRSQQIPFEMTISGILGEYPLVSNGNDVISIPKTNNKRTIYSVLVEGRTGKIFWFEPIQQAHDKVLDAFAEKMLRQMTFTADPKVIAISGQIDMQFNGVP